MRDRIAQIQHKFYDYPLIPSPFAALSVYMESIMYNVNEEKSQIIRLNEITNINDLMCH